MKYLPIPGTWAISGDWWKPGSYFNKKLYDLDWDLIYVDPDDSFWWSTDVNGVPLTGKNDWRAGGVALRYYLRPPLHVVDPDFVPLGDRNLIAHSHGLQVVLYACGMYGLKINTLISVCSPVRKDMMQLAEDARPNIGRWIHLYDPGFTDRMQWLGAVFDGKCGITRQHPYADSNKKICGGHGGILHELQYLEQWEEILQGEISLLQTQSIVK